MPDPRLAARAPETSGIGRWSWDIVAGTARYSRHVRALLELSPEEFPDTIAAFFDRMPPDDRVTVSNALRQHLEHRLPYDVEFRMSTRAGAYRWFRARGQATWSDTGVALQMSGTNVDVTDLRTQEQSLRRSEARLRRAPCDLVFMNLHMPGMNGFAATAAIRHLEHERGTTATPIVAMTGAVTAEDRAPVAAAGMDDHITTPLDRATLYACVQRWLAFPRRDAGAVLPRAMPAPAAARPAKRATDESVSGD